MNRVFDSAGPEGKVRGTPQQIIEKYVGLTRDAQLSGDRIAAENFQQHAEHYSRMLNDAQREQAERQAAEARNRPNNQQQNQADQAGQPHKDTPAERPGEGEQPDVAVVLEPAATSELVETPENAVNGAPGDQPARRPRSRSRRPAKEDPAEAPVLAEESAPTPPDQPEETQVT